MRMRCWMQLDGGEGVLWVVRWECSETAPSCRLWFPPVGLNARGSAAGGLALFQ